MGGRGENIYFLIKLVHVAAAASSDRKSLSDKEEKRQTWMMLQQYHDDKYTERAHSVLTAFDKRISSIIKFNFKDYKS